MFRPRVIPCLLLKDMGLVKTIKFKKRPMPKMQDPNETNEGTKRIKESKY